MRTRTAALAMAVAGLSLLSACSSNDEPLAAVDVPAPTASATAEPTSEPSEAPAVVAPASVEANELGQVPVFMYHQFKPDPKGEYDQTLEEFEAEIERLYAADYRPVTAAAYISGQMDIPAGKHPFVMTFDDSTVSEAQIGPDGQPTADTALGALEAFGKENPDFRPTATFYVNSNAFSDEKVLPWLVENGYEIGVHTMSHANLKQLSAEDAQEELAGNYAEIKAAVPDAKITSMALPFGVWPANRVLAYRGSYDGTSYDLDGVMLVGSNPAPSPFSAKFDPLAVPRIRSGLGNIDFDSNYWLDMLDESPKSLYTSDGDPSTISFPSTSTVDIDSEWADRANEYDPSGSADSPAEDDASSSEAEASATAGPGAEPAH